MEYRKLGNSGLKISELSYGSWVTFVNQLKEKDAMNCMSLAYENGVNFFDYAEAYASGESEKLMGKICFDQIDVLVIDEIGKEISGGGCDPNITGNKNEPGFEKPNVSKIVLLDLTDKTKGNATGFAAADVITKKLFDKIDFPTTYANVVASSKLEGGKIPIPMKDGDQAVRLALKTLNGIDPIKARVVRIKNTLKLAEIYVSEAMLKDVDENSMLEAITAPSEMSFNSSQF